jgi:peptidoglycan/xylan/chitin deacetylase (PgdA/CDA1 family)
VTELESDPQLLSVTPRHFSEHLRVLRQRYNVVPLRDLTNGQFPRRGQKRSVVITFDDGYADNFHEARPLLEAAGCPATVFVTSGKIDDDREFWWDELERIFLLTPRLPQKLRLTIDGDTHEWRFTDSGCNANGARRWHVLFDAPLSPRQAAYLNLANLLRRQSQLDRLRVLDELLGWAGIAAHGRPSHRPMSRDEVRALAKDDLVEVGAHAVAHSSLAAITADAQRTEIFGSKDELERILQRPVLSFAYPFGTRGDYDAATIRLVREAGFDCACTNVPGVITRGLDPYQWPRSLVRDWSGDEFDRQVEAAFDQ